MCMPSHLDAIDEMLFYSALHIILFLQNLPEWKKETNARDRRIIASQQYHLYEASIVDLVAVQSA